MGIENQNSSKPTVGREDEKVPKEQKQPANQSIPVKGKSIAMEWTCLFLDRMLRHHDGSDYYGSLDEK